MFFYNKIYYCFNQNYFFYNFSQELSTKNLIQTHERTGHLYLIGTVVRQGSMAAKEVDPRRRSQSQMMTPKKASVESIKRFVQYSYTVYFTFRSQKSNYFTVIYNLNCMTQKGNTLYLYF